MLVASPQATGGTAARRASTVGYDDKKGLSPEIRKFGFVLSRGRVIA
jgi:hypothetical protein